MDPVRAKDKVQVTKRRSSSSSRPTNKSAAAQATDTGQTRLPEELRTEQNKRLTSRHINALIELQDIKQENVQLRSKLDFLEKEMSSCQKLHQLARDAELKIKQMEDESEKKVKELVKDMMNKHDEEIQRVLRDKNNLKTQWEKEEKTLIERINVLEALSKEQKEKFEHMEQQAIDVEVLHEKLEDAIKSLKEVRQENRILDKTKQELEKECISLKLEKEDLLSQVKSQNEDINRLRVDLQNETELKRQLVNQSDFVKEIDRLTTELNGLQIQKDTSEKIINDLNDTKSELTKSLAAMESKAALIELERDAVKQSAHDLRNEVDFLKEQLGSTKVQPSSSFAEFVQLKREMKELKDENSKLKRSSSKNISVDVLKTDGSRSRQQLNSKTRRPKSGSKI